MKNLHYYILGAAALLAVSCSDEVEPVAIDIPSSSLQFTPVMGGAVLHYQLPDRNDVVGIHVRYLDAYGQEILRTASALCDSMELVGFNEAKADVECQVTLQLVDHTESAPVTAHFSTLDSAPIQFIQSVEVFSGWDGFSMNYSSPFGSEGTGMGHVFYLGTNPHSGEPDTILMKTFTLYDTEGVVSEVFKNKQDVEHTTVVVRAEDYRGYMVGERVFEDIASVNTAKLDPKLFKIYYSNSLEIPEEMVGLEYLTDGDTKGTRWWETQDDHIYHTFISDRHGAGEGSVPMYIDMGQLRPTSQVRLYAHLYLGSGTCYGRPCFAPKNWCSGRADGSECQTVQVISGDYSNDLPCSVTVYGCRNAGDTQDFEAQQWELLGSYSEDPDADYEDRWCYDAYDCGGIYYPSAYRTLAKCEAAQGIYMPINFPADGQDEGFRYLKLVFNDVFHLTDGMEENSNYKNTYKYITFHELEVYTKK